MGNGSQQSAGWKNLRSEFCALTSKGLESLCADEIYKKFGCKAIAAREGCVFFNYEGDKEAPYNNLRSVHFLVQVIAKSKQVKIDEDTAKLIGSSMLVRVTPSNNSLESEVGGQIFDQLVAMGKQIRVEFKQPETFIRCWAFGKKLVVGIDWGKTQLSKRLRVFTTRFSLNPVSAYALAAANNAQGDGAFLVTNEGSELVEAALLGGQGKLFGVAINKVIHRGVRQNATVAGVIDKVELLEQPWEAAFESFPNSSLGSVSAQLNFVRDSEGNAAVKTFQRLIACARGKLAPEGWINILARTEDKKYFERAAVGYKLDSTLEFMQGELGFALLSFKFLG